MLFNVFSYCHSLAKKTVASRHSYCSNLWMLQNSCIWGAVLLFITKFWISIIYFWKSILHFLDIHNSFLDINNSFFWISSHTILRYPKIELSNFILDVLNSIDGYLKLDFWISKNRILDIQKSSRNLDIQKSIFGYPQIEFWIPKNLFFDITKSSSLFDIRKCNQE